MTTTTEFTPAPFCRSHGHLPKGRGSWAFQQSATVVAYDRDLYGDVVFFSGTLTEAKAQAKTAFPGALVAVLP